MRAAISIALLLGSMAAIFHLCYHSKGVMGGFLWPAGVAWGAFFRENVKGHSLDTGSAATNGKYGI